MRIYFTELSSMWLQKITLLISAEESPFSDLAFTEIVFVLV